MTVTTRPAGRRAARTAVATTVAVVVALLGLAGCTSDKVAAYVAGKPVMTISELDQIAPPVAQAIQAQDGPQLRSVIVSSAISLDLARKLATEQQVTVAPQEIAQLQQQQFVSSPDPKAQALLSGVVETELIRQKVEQKNPELWARTMRDADVNVNPRIGGVWKDTGQGVWGVGEDGSLSVAAGPASPPAGEQQPPAEPQQPPAEQQPPSGQPSQAQPSQAQPSQAQPSQAPSAPASSASGR